MRLRLLSGLLFALMCLSTPGKANNSHILQGITLEQEFTEANPGQGLKMLFRKLALKAREKGPKGQGGQKVMVVALGITLGPFGVHRLYLGTETRVPVFYTLTLGGGFGILPVCDMIAVLLTKDLEQYIDSPRFIMWAE